MNTIQFYIDTNYQNAKGKISVSFSNTGKLEIFFQSIEFSHAKRSFHIEMRSAKKILMAYIIEKLNGSLGHFYFSSTIRIEGTEAECLTISQPTDVDSAETLSL